MRQIYLVRHAQTRYVPTERDEDRPLTAAGRDQAAALSEALLALGIEEVHSSPYRRCVDTIGPFAERAGLPVNHVTGLRERSFTRDPVHDWDTLWKKVWSDFDFAFPDGESSRQAQARMYEATLQVVTTSVARTLAISSHGNVIGLLLQHIDRRFAFEHACAIRNPEVLRVTFDGASLRWDADFSLDALASFATRVDTRTHVAAGAAAGAART
ncbi:MAG TPA: histidine phosphatase family protein [Gammaproteobacteria bacterium]|nr:histidine phosphatase family protein [Gammaproteobacteria bacterium]